MRVLIAVALIALSGCASQPTIKASWIPQDNVWEQGRTSGLRLAYTQGGSYFIPQAVVNNLMTTKERLERLSGLSVDLAVVDIDQINAFATYHQGVPVVAFSIPYLNHLGFYRDAVAATMGHELAHLYLRHSADERQERERGAATAGFVAGTILNSIIPFSGNLASAGITAYARSFTRDEERAADEQGLKWVVAAGFNPCGQAKVVDVASKLGPVNVPLLSTHPSYGERSELANEYAKKAGLPGCD